MKTRSAPWLGSVIFVWALGYVPIVLGNPIQSRILVDETGYRDVGTSVEQLIAASRLPGLYVSPDRNWLLLAQFRDAPAIDELMEPRISLGVMTLNPRSGRAAYLSDLASGLRVMSVRGRPSWLAFGSNDHISEPLWSADSRHFLVARVVPEGTEIWVGNVASQKLWRLAARDLAGMRSVQPPCTWMPRGNQVLCRFIPAERGPAPEAADVVARPSIEESDLQKVAGMERASYLRNAHDETLFDYYLSSQLGLIDIHTMERRSVGDVGVFDFVNPSPDGRYIFLSRIVRPYSHIDRVEHFAREFQILDAEGHLIKVVSHRGLGRRGNGPLWALPGARHFTWNPRESATLIYIEALDGGDPRLGARYRDRVLAIAAPFSAPPVELLRTKGRLIAVPESRRFVRTEDYQNFLWLPDGSLWVEEIVPEQMRKTVWKVDASAKVRASAAKLMDFPYGDLSKGLGTPILVGGTEHADPVLQTEGDAVLLMGREMGVAGERPFLDSFNIKKLTRTRLFTSSDEEYQEPLLVLNDGSILLRVESATNPPNYYLRGSTTSSMSALLAPAPVIAESSQIRPKRIVYKRNDGLGLSGMLYLPPNSVPGRCMPVLIWAYPKSYESPELVGQVQFSSSRYPWTSGHPLKLVAQLLVTFGYAVLLDAGMPIVGTSGGNDTAVAQIVANAQAAVDHLVAEGIADPSRVSIAGHSYGGTMVANLLANTDLFAAGIAVSGAYNFTKTPGGFGHERRNLWEAKEVYLQLSPLFSADRIDAPLLLIHGENDSNTNAPADESRRMFRALRGLGKRARLVVLPFEDHVPRARESLQHIAWEMRSWLDASIGPMENVRSSCGR